VVVVAAGAIFALVYEKGGGPVHAPDTIARFALGPQPVTLPGVAFGDAAGKRHTLAEFKGRYVLLNLWATWCAPCVQELPSLLELQKQMGNTLVVLPVDVGRGDAAEAVQFFKSHGVAALPVYMDSDIALVRALKGYGLPLTVLLDPQGREIGRAAGPGDWGAPDSVEYFKGVIAARAPSG
jgi:thiol-disulfide isomerase/thioredoxin